MEPIFAITISGRIIAEFDDDASELPERESSSSPVVDPLHPATRDLTPPSELGRRTPSDR